MERLLCMVGEVGKLNLLVASYGIGFALPSSCHDLVVYKMVCVIRLVHSQTLDPR